MLGRSMMFGGQVATWNALDKQASWSLSADALTATKNSVSSLAGLRGLPPMSAGKLYLEFVSSVFGFNPTVGIAASGWDELSALGSSTPSAGYNSAGGVTINGSSAATLSSWGGADTIQMAVDLDGHKIWFRKAGDNWNGNVANNPATNVGGLTISAGAYYPAASSVRDDVIIIRPEGFGGTVPAGFTTWAG